MTIPLQSNSSLNFALNNIISNGETTRAQAQAALTTLQAGPVDSNWIFRFLDQVAALTIMFNNYKNVTGLTAYAQAQIPGYVGNIVNDVNATVTALQLCRDWIVTNFPKDTTLAFILSHTLNADGTRTPRNFSSAQTLGLQNLLISLIATIN